MLADGFEEIEALTVVDILRRAEIKVNIVAAREVEKVTGAHGIKVIPDITISQMEIGDALVLPGGMPGVTNLMDNPAVAAQILLHKERRKYIAAICAAPSILGEMGLLEGKNATCFPGFEEKLKGAKIGIDSVIVDDIFVTSRGAGTSADFAFVLVALIKNEGMANELRKTMLYE